MGALALLSCSGRGTTYIFGDAGVDDGGPSTGGANQGGAIPGGSGRGGSVAAGGGPPGGRAGAAPGGNANAGSGGSVVAGSAGIPNVAGTGGALGGSAGTSSEGGSPNGGSPSGGNGGSGCFDGPSDCCPPEYPVWCNHDYSVGHCFNSGTSCSTVTVCYPETFARTCPAGDFVVCWSTPCFGSNYGGCYYSQPQCL